MLEFHSVVVRIEPSHDVPAGIIPVDDVVVIRPGVPTNTEIKIEAVGEHEWPLQILGSHAVKRLGAVQHNVGVVGIGSAMLDPAGVFKSSSFETFGKQIGRGGGRVHRQDHRVTGRQRSVAHRHSDARGSNLVRHRRYRDGASSATAAKDDVPDRHKRRIG